MNKLRDIWASLIGVLGEHPLLVRGFALFPVVMVSTSLKNAVDISLAFLIMTCIPVVVLSFFVEKIPGIFRTPVYVLFSIALYPFAAWCAGLFGTDMLASLGIYLPLICVNGILTDYAYKPEGSRKWWQTAFKVFCECFEFFVVICIISLVREALVYATVWGVPLPVRITVRSAGLPFAGLILLALLIGAFQYAKTMWQRLREKRAAKKGVK